MPERRRRPWTTPWVEMCDRIIGIFRRCRYFSLNVSGDSLPPPFNSTTHTPQKESSGVWHPHVTCVAVIPSQLAWLPKKHAAALSRDLIRLVVSLSLSLCLGMDRKMDSGVPLGANMGSLSLLVYFSPPQ